MLLFLISAANMHPLESGTRGRKGMADARMDRPEREGAGASLHGIKRSHRNHLAARKRAGSEL